MSDAKLLEPINPDIPEFHPLETSLTARAFPWNTHKLLCWFKTITFLSIQSGLCTFFSSFSLNEKVCLLELE